MGESSAIDLLFGGMEKLGPGGEVSTLRALALLPHTDFTTVVDAGCGTGRQTLTLARNLSATVHAVDSYAPFLESLDAKAQEAGLAARVEAHHLDMGAIPEHFSDIDLLWSEGAVYNLGFEEALTCWQPAIRPGGFAVVSEACWLKEEAPAAVKAFWNASYPGMGSTRVNRQRAERAGYRCRDTYTLPELAWEEDFYQILEPRAKALVEHPDRQVRAFAEEMIQEIEIFRSSEGSYGYVFYILERL